MPDHTEPTMEELKAANAALREFVAVAAHELRGPMAAILGFASTMRKHWDRFPDPERLEFLDIIERRSRYLTRLLDSLLTVSKIEAGALEVQPEAVPVAAAIDQALDDMADRWRVEVKCPDDLKAMADPDHLQRFIVNFLRNAEKYGEPPIVVTASEEGDQVTITVSDQGKGIPAEFASQLFEPFARATTDDTEKGTGLGLSIVRGMARANGGDVWYEPNEPQGSIFGVRLPKASS